MISLRKIIRGSALLLIAVMFIIGVWQWQVYQQTPTAQILVPGTTIAGVSVGNLSQDQAATRLDQAYAEKIELHYRDAIIQATPEELGFQLNTDEMLAGVSSQHQVGSLASFWDFLWHKNQPISPKTVPLSDSISEEKLRAYLVDQIASRYDQPPSAALPIPDSTQFESGKPGYTLSIEEAIPLIEKSLSSLQERTIDLPVSEQPALPVDPQNLKIVLKQLLNQSGFDGLLELDLRNLQTGTEIHFASDHGNVVPSDISFTAASTIKIPIMVSVFRRVDEPMPADIETMLQHMIVLSENPPADELMDQVIEANSGPLKVTEDMQTLGLKNTFLAGYFHLGAPLLQLFETPANTRQDINVHPDVYNQTTAGDMATLMQDIYQCAVSNNGPMLAAFGGEVSQAECKQMIDYLLKNKNSLLIEAGLPEGTPVAHKHGWIEETDGYIHTLCDVGIVYTPGGNYVFSIYVYHPTQLVFDPVNVLVAQLSQAVYNSYNLDHQESWMPWTTNTP